MTGQTQHPDQVGKGRRSAHANVCSFVSSRRSGERLACHEQWHVSPLMSENAAPKSTSIECGCFLNNRCTVNNGDTRVPTLFKLYRCLLALPHYHSSRDNVSGKGLRIRLPVSFLRETSLPNVTFLVKVVTNGTNVPARCGIVLSAAPKRRLLFL